MEQKPSQITTNPSSVINQQSLSEHNVQSSTVQLNQSSLKPQQLSKQNISQLLKQSTLHKEPTQQVQKQLNQPEQYNKFHQQEGHEYQSYEMEHQNTQQNNVDQDASNFDQLNDIQTQKSEIKQQIKEEPKQIQQKPIKKISSAKLQQQPIKQVSNISTTNNFSKYQNQKPTQQKNVSPIKVQQSNKAKEQGQKIKQQPVKQGSIKKQKPKISQQKQSKALSQNKSVQNKKQVISDQNKKIGQNKDIKPQNNEGGNKPESNQQKIIRQQPQQNQVSEVKQEVSQIIQIPTISAGIIIFQAQRQRIGTTLQHFLKFTTKHQKHITNQKQLIRNVQQEIQKKRVQKTSLCNVIRDYFDDFVGLCKDLYQRSYKFAKNQKTMTANPMINMRQQLKSGIDQLIFLRKSSGNQYNRLGQFISSNITKNIVKVFTDYWKSIGIAQTKHKEKKQEFIRKQKQFIKRINKVIKVYTKGKQGTSQEEDLFIQMIKFINHQKQYRNVLIEYGTGLIPLKKAFIKAQQILYEELQVLFNTYKNQFRTLYSIHPKQFIQIQKMEKFIKQNNTFEKLSDITDGDYVRSVLLTLQKGTIQQLTDKQFEKVLHMQHLEQIMGSSVQLLKGTTTKSFQLKNKAEQVVDTVSGNLLIFNKETAQMKEKFIIKNINARIVQDGVVEIDQVLKGIIFDSHRTVRITFRDNDRAEELICFLNQVHQNIKENELAANNKK